MVLDYPTNQAAGLVKSGKPRRLHRADCPHPAGHAIYRRATAEELQSLPECADCAHKEAQRI